MTDDEIRQLVRSAIAKHLGGQAAVLPASRVSSSTAPPSIGQGPVSVSFSRYSLPRAADEVMCLIEPAVRCNHCGYCECHGH